VGVIAGGGIFWILAPHLRRHETDKVVATQPQPAPQAPVTINPTPPTTTMAETKSAAPAEKDAAPPKASPSKAESSKTTGRTQVTQSATPLTPTPVQKPQPACTMTPFVLADYGGAQSGDLIWSGNAPSNEIEIHGRQSSLGRATGDWLPRGVPVRLTVGPDGVRASSFPSAANCWQGPLVLKSSGPMPSRVTVHWEVFQP
jgi:hypothetical protein